MSFVTVWFRGLVAFAAPFQKKLFSDSPPELRSAASDWRRAPSGRDLEGGAFDETGWRPGPLHFSNRKSGCTPSRREGDGSASGGSGSDRGSDALRPRGLLSQTQSGGGLWGGTVSCFVTVWFRQLACVCGPFSEKAIQRLSARTAFCGVRPASDAVRPRSRGWRV